MDKEQHRRLREQHRQEKTAYRLQKAQQDPSNYTVDCACVIHGVGYSWHYVDVLYNMICRNISYPIRFHVYTEPARNVPANYIRHDLEDWGITGPKKSWWYKMQLFNSDHHSGPLLYFDLDNVIVNNIDWILASNTNYFWAIKDFKYLWKPTHQGINSSVMYWDTSKFHYVWQQFKNSALAQVMHRYPGGDQDYVSQAVEHNKIRYFDNEAVQSWRWQCFDGGYNFKKRTWNSPGSGTKFPEKTSILVLHGKPKPDQTTDPVILEHWK